jgi:hypothetical protein
MMITCSKCGRKQPLTDEDVAAFHPYFFCLTCGEKLSLAGAEEKVQALRRSNDRSRVLAAADLQALPPADQVRRVVKRDGAAADGGG